MIIVRNNIVPFRGFSAMTLWPFIFVHRDARFSDRTERHERIHGEQQKEMLALPFLLWYVAEWLVRLAIYRNADKAYRAISFEQEAYGHDGDEDYLSHRRHFAWLRYLKPET